MPDFPTLSYTSTNEIATLLYTWCLKTVPLSGVPYPFNYAIMESTAAEYNLAAETGE